jgi:hypothetical protein
MSERSRAKLVYSLGDTLEKHLDELETLNNGRQRGWGLSFPSASVSACSILSGSAWTKVLG